MRKSAVELSIATGEEHKVEEAKHDEILQLKIDLETKEKGMIDKKVQIEVLKEQLARKQPDLDAVEAINADLSNRYRLLSETMSKTKAELHALAAKEQDTQDEIEQLIGVNEDLSKQIDRMVDEVKHQHA